MKHFIYRNRLESSQPHFFAARTIKTLPHTAECMTTQPTVWGHVCRGQGHWLGVGADPSRVHEGHCHSSWPTVQSASWGQSSTDLIQILRYTFCPIYIIILLLLSLPNLHYSIIITVILSHWITENITPSQCPVFHTEGASTALGRLMLSKMHIQYVQPLYFKLWQNEVNLFVVTPKISCGWF